MSATVTYKGNILTTVDNEIKILETAGTWLEGDILIEDETQAESIVAEDIPNSTGVECQITGDYSGGTVTQDANGYIVLSASGGSGGGSDTLTALLNDTLTDFTYTGTETLNQYAFSGKNNLSELILDNVTAIPNYMAYNCCDLEHIRALSATSIGQSALQGCTASTNGLIVVLPSLTSISVDAFRASYAKAIDLGSGVSLLPNRCLYATGSGQMYETLILRKSDNAVEITSSSFALNYQSSPLVVYVPSVLISTYQNATNWSTFYGNNKLTFSAIEGSIYENAYADGTLIE